MEDESRSKLLCNEQLHRRMGANVRAYVEKRFRWGMITEKWYELYSEFS